jgi:hypothetical protein
LGGFSLSPFLPLVLSSLLLTTSCSGLSPLKFLSGGTNVAANTQVGKSNSQTIGQTNNIAPTVSLRPNSRVEKVDQSVTGDSKINADSIDTVVLEERDPLVYYLLVIGLVLFAAWSWFLYKLPSPDRVWRKE